MLLQYYRILMMISLSILISSCTQVEDYMFGKDNTPTPSKLKHIKEVVSFTQRWSVNTGKAGKTNAYLKLAPVIFHGVVYTASPEGAVQATKKGNGKILWSQQLPYHLVSGPVVDHDYIIVTTDSSSVVVLEKKDGSVRWKANLSGDALAKPVVADGQVFVKTIDGNLYAYQLKTGEKLWVVDHGSPSLILKASSSPVVMDKLVLVGFSDGRLDAIERKTGLIVWQRNIAYASGGSDVERLIDIDADPIVIGDEIYLASYQGYVGALSLKNGEFVWRKPASIYKNIVISGGTLYYVDNDSVVWAINRTNGQVLWKQPALKARNLTEPVLMGNRLLVGETGGLLHGLNINNGELVSRISTTGPVYAAPVVDGSSVYVLTANAQLTRYTVK